MPGIGNPNTTSNPFAKISKFNGPRPGNNKPAQAKSVGEQLNQIAGIEEESRFVDRNNHNKMDKDAFLKLLSNQLANQDPLKPVDQKKFAADMAQFAQLEQMTNINTKLDKNAVNKDNQAKFMATSFIGKVAKTSGTSIPYDGVSRSVDLPFYLEKPASKVLVRVFDESNNLVHQQERDSMGMGLNSVLWDGKQLDGIRATKENYRFEVRAYDQNMQPFMGKTFSEGLVTGVSFENGETVLTVGNNRKVYLRDVESFAMPKQNTSAANAPQLKKDVNAAYNNINETTL